MKQTMQKIAIALCMALAFAACKNDDPETGGGVENVTITLNSTKLTLKVGEEKTLVPTITGTDSKTVTWKSSDNAVATVINGKVTAKGEGTATITATAKADTTKTATCTVTVTKADIAVTLDPSKLTLKVDEVKMLVPTITGTDSKAVTWKSSDETVATVDSNGKVTAKKKGAATITVTLTVDTTKTATCDVTVVDKDEIMPDGVTLNKDNLSLKIGGTETLTATITNTTDVKNEYKTITWTSSDEKVATVDKNGKVTAIDAGTATITATTQNEKKATCTVTVTAQTTAPVTASEDEWNFVKKAGLSDGDITEDTDFLGDKENLTLNVLVEAGTGIGTKGTRACKYDSKIGLGFKKDILKIDNIKGSVEVVIQWYLNGSSDRNLEIAMGNGELEKVASGESKGDKTAYTNTFDAGEGKTLYIAASDWLYIKSITIKPQSGSGTGTQPSTPTKPPYAGSTPTPVEDNDYSGKNISLTDPVLGYASLGNSYATGTGKKVSTKEALKDAIKKGGVIIIDGMIDMSDGYLPDSTSDFPNLTTLDAFVKKQNKGYSTYAAWVNAYALACTEATEDKSKDDSNSSLYDTVWAFNKAYGDIIKLSVPSNTTLIGAGPGCGIKGGSIQITSAKNVQIRNLTIKDAFDPFPHHEVGDQYNAQWDGVVVEGSENVWIDHCTFEDTLAVGHVYTAGTRDEKWQMYDGLCDIKNRTSPASKTTNVTVSNCIFRNHDKTMLIGSGTSDGSNAERFVTLQGNYFYNCGQRLPMVRNTTIHILNNYYDAGSNPVYKQNYAIGCRETSIIYAEANYFGSGIQYSFDNNQGTVHASGNNDSSAKKMNKTTITDETLFSTALGAYSYTPLPAEQAKTNAMSSAGAGYTLK